MCEDIMTGNTDDLFADDRAEYREAMEKDRRDRQSLYDGDQHRLALRFCGNDPPEPVITCLDVRGKDKPCYMQDERAQDCMVAFCAREIGWDAFIPFHGERELPYTETTLLRINTPVRYWFTGSGEDFEDYFGVDLGTPEPS